jgi:antitoxin FitA
MAKMIQVRNVPEPLHLELTRRAKAEGLTLTHYIQRILEREVSRPSRREVLDRVASREPIDLGAPAAEIIRAERRRAGRE